jgi:hypothetical protein
MTEHGSTMFWSKVRFGFQPGVLVVKPDDPAPAVAAHPQRVIASKGSTIRTCSFWRHELLSKSKRFSSISCKMIA